LQRQPDDDTASGSASPRFVMVSRPTAFGYADEMLLPFKGTISLGQCQYF
jgi:hypothetical protein